MENTYTPLKEYLGTQGKDFSMANLGSLAKDKGIANYTGTDAQNKQLYSSVSTPAIPTAEKKPTPVVGANLASKQVEKITDTLNQAKQSIADFQAKKNITTINKKTNVDGTADLFMSDGSRVKTDASGNIMGPQTAEDKIADTADPGMKFAYGADGSRTMIPINESASKYGMSDTNPTVAPVKPVLATAELPSGTSVKQYNDGSYGLYDQTGKYIGAATATQFKNAQNGQDVLDKLNQAVNGNYPLTSSQQAQIDGIKATYQNIMKEQEKYNANYEGGTRVAQNLYGIGNTMMGQGAIKGVIDQGVAKIAEIQSKMNSDVAKMTQAFQSDNLQLLKDAYTAYSQNSKALQDNIDKIDSEVITIARDTAQQRAQAELAIDNDIRGLIDVATKAGAAPQQLQAMQDALDNHDYTAAAKAGGESLMSSSGVVGEYYAYSRDAKSRGLVPMSMDDYFTKDANRKASIARAGASVMSGTDMTAKQQAIFNAIVDAQNKNPTALAAQKTYNLEKTAAAVKANPNDPQLQLALIYQTIQILDNYNSAVREGEISLVQGTVGLKDKIENLPDKISNGQILPASVATNYANLAQLMIKSVRDGAEKQNNKFRAQAAVNGISKPFSEYETTIEELNKKMSVGEEHINQAADAQTSLKNAAASNPDLAAQIHAALQKEPDPVKVYQALKARGKI